MSFFFLNFPSIFLYFLMRKVPFFQVWYVKKNRTLSFPWNFKKINLCYSRSGHQIRFLSYRYPMKKCFIMELFFTPHKTSEYCPTIISTFFLLQLQLIRNYIELRVKLFFQELYCIYFQSEINLLFVEIWNLFW